MQILFEHPWFIVVNKPVDLLTQAVDGIQSVQSTLVDLLQQRDPTGPTPFIGVPHRLDRVTTGVMVFARNQRSLKRLCQQFAARTVSKKYHALVTKNINGAELSDPDLALPNSTLPERVLESNAIVQNSRVSQSQHGSSSDSCDALSNDVLSNDVLRWEDWIRKLPEIAEGEVCAESDEGAKKAVLQCRKLQEGRIVSPAGQQDVPASLYEIELETGRMHQIRIQFSSRGLPIVGDKLYGSTQAWMTGEFRQDPIALHARSLSFRHPQTAERLTFEAPYPESWKQFSSNLGDRAASHGRLT